MFVNLPFLEHLSTKNSIFVIITLLLSSCSNSPRIVEASRPLVENVQLSEYQEIPQQYWEGLEDENQSQLIHDNTKIRLAERFTSALGYKCRSLYIYDDTQKEQHRIACQTIMIEESGAQQTDQMTWYLMPAIVDSDEVFL